MNHRFAVLFIAVLFWQGAALAQSAPSQGGQSGNRVNLDFANADVVAVIQAIGEMTGKNLLVDPRVKGTLTLSTPRPVSRAVAYDLLLSALRLQGYAAVESGGVIRVVPEAEAKFYAVPITGKKRPAASGQMVSRVFQLRHESASQLVAVLRPLVSPNSVISADAMSNTLLVTDYAENVGRLAQIIDSMDVAGVGDPVIMPLRYASAQEVAGLINRVFGTAAPGQTADMSRVDVAVDSRTNSLIVRTESPARLSRVQVLVNSLDVPTPVAGNVHVIYLKNAEAAKVAQTLRNILSGDTASLAPTAPATTPAGTATAAGAAQARNTAGADTAGPGMVQADPATNALIITAPDAVFSNLKAVVEKLDVRRAQVLVEALIAEVTADKAAEFGIQWMNLSGLDDSGTSVIGGFGNSSASSNIGVVAANPAASARGFNLGIVDGTVTIPGIDEPIANLGLLARALETNANANILSTPSLLALDNEEAKISIGANVPFQTGQYQITGSSAAPFQTIERKDVGLTLRVKPQISEGGSIRLEIYQEVSKLRASENVTLATTDKRSIESTVLVDDGQMIVLGGLIEDNLQETEDKVPVLGDIPILKHLFRYDVRKQTKTNLMVFLRPRIIRDREQAAAVTHPRYDYTLGLHRDATPARKPLLPDVEAPSLRFGFQLGTESPDTTP